MIPSKFIIADANPLVAAWVPLRYFYADQKFPLAELWSSGRIRCGSVEAREARKQRGSIRCSSNENNREDNPRFKSKRQSNAPESRLSSNAFPGLRFRPGRIKGYLFYSALAVVVHLCLCSASHVSPWLTLATDLRRNEFVQSHVSTRMVIYSNNTGPLVLR